MYRRATFDYRKQLTTKNFAIMKTEQSTINKIIEAITCKREDLFNDREYDKVTDAIFWAWDNWEESVLKSYYTGEKPTEPTEQFRRQWLENEFNAVPENYEDLFESYKG